MEEDKIYWRCYAEGWNAWNVYFTSNWVNKWANPYTFESDEWKAWNAGWNHNTQGVD